MDLREDATAMLDELMALRRELHQIPEVGLALPPTQERVLSELQGLPVVEKLPLDLASRNGTCAAMWC
jgi:metal-dependent amidase/aminoacylase/carboxypeptidase family protein